MSCEKKKFTQTLLAVILCSTLLSVVSCSSTKPQNVRVEYYRPAYRQIAPEPVYSRLTWSHLSSPDRPKLEGNAPLLLPIVSFELGSTTLDEAVEALAQTMGYRWSYPKDLAKRSVRLKMEGTVEEILNEIGRQAKVNAGFDHANRTIRIFENDEKRAGN